MKLRKVQPRQLIVGDKVPQHIYTNKRVLLLAKGERVESRQQQESLLLVGYYDPDEKEITRDVQAQNFSNRAYDYAVNPFLELETIYHQLYELALSLQEGRKPHAVEAQIIRTTQTLQSLAAQNPDALLGAAHWPQKLPLASLMHTLRCAVVVALVLPKTNLTLAEQEATICAALTANLSMLDLQEKLNYQNTPLDSIQKSRIFAHPERSAFLLSSLGITNKTWLTAVLQHHERLDGSGYPKKLKGEAINVPARLIALADSYTAMTVWREYRPLLSPRQAMRELLGNEQEQLDKQLAKVFLSQLGIYPPGSLVSLANGDTAVVIERGIRINEPICASIRAASGQSYLPPPKRNTGETGFAIQKLLNQEALTKLQPFLFWNIKTAQQVQAL